MGRHTPGEWKVMDEDGLDAACIYVDLPEDRAGPDAISILVNADWATDEDLYLMRAAPTMLEALQAAAVTIQAALPIAEEAGYDDNSAAERTLDQVRAAIRAATGEP